VKFTPLHNSSAKNKALAAMKQRIKSDQTVVLVSHNAAQVREMCDRGIWIEQGRIQQQGDSREVLDAYRKFSAA
jgi:lipopolysaccharide transport system ATP-binding protein